MDAHAPLDPAVDGALLVEGKVVARVRPQENDDLFQGALGLALKEESRLRHKGGPLEVGDDFSGEFLDRGHDVGETCVDGASGHAVEFGRSGVLHEDHPRFLLDGLEAHRAVGAHARENDADAPLPAVVRQGAEEEVDGQAQTPGRRRIEQVEYPVEDGHILVGWYHIDVVRLDCRAVLDLDDLHGGGALEELRHDALVRRVQVLDDDKGHTACLRHVLQELFEGLQPSGGGANADNGKLGIARGGRCSLFCIPYPPGFHIPGP